MHIVHDAADLGSFDAGGLEPLECTEDSFIGVLSARNHTLKRALADPSLLSGIGVIRRYFARRTSSPFRQTKNLTSEEWSRLLSMRHILRLWVDRLAYSGSFQLRSLRLDQKWRFTVCSGNRVHGKMLRDRAFSQLLRCDGTKPIEDLEAHSGLSKIGGSFAT